MLSVKPPNFYHMPAAGLRYRLGFLLASLYMVSVHAQQNIVVTKSGTSPDISVTCNGKPFTAFFFPDTLEKPVLYPIYAADGNLITRGFPLMPRNGEPTDHPHHIGLWLNYEKVNGLDFWNNSFAIPADKKPQYGWIRNTKVLETKSGKEGIIKYSADWQDIKHNTLLTEATTLSFTGSGKTRIITRTTTLTANERVSFDDSKDGMLGLRVARELQLPDTTTKKFVDDKGNVTVVKAFPTASGNYITSEGKQGDAAWGTRGTWCMLYGKEGNDTISIAILDHPKNVGYPTYWHARGYGLFAANPLGQKVFSNGAQTLNLALEKGQSVTFRYRIVIQAGNSRLSNAEVNNMASEFAKMQ